MEIGTWGSSGCETAIEAMGLSEIVQEECARREQKQSRAAWRKADSNEPERVAKGMEGRHRSQEENSPRRESKCLMLPIVG